MTEWIPDARELADLELLLSGAFAPLTGFLTAAEAHEVIEHGRLPDGSPWPDPIKLSLPQEIQPDVIRPGDRITLRDPEGAAVALLTVRELSEQGVPYGHGELGDLDHGDAEHGDAEHGDGGHGLGRYVAGRVEALDAPAYGPFARLRRTPEEVRKELPEGEILAVTMRGPLDSTALEDVAATAEELDAAVMLMPLTFGESGPAVVRAALKAAERLPRSMVVAVPLAPREDAEIDLELREHVARNYGATEHYAGPAPVAIPGPPHRRGLVVFFTGLSGSGKSTIARGLRDALLERGGRTITYLDGDVVRRMLSAGLTFSREDRDRNIRRIGFVAAEVARHGGLAICAPIAPYAATREEVRAMAEEVGADFLLVHVATPLEECERRDRKGLYAKARAGQIPEFTGISDPYEEPEDADLVIDTTGMSVERAVNTVLGALTSGGWVR